MPASRSARAMIFAPRSWPSRPGLATTTRILRSVFGFSAAPASMAPPRIPSVVPLAGAVAPGAGPAPREERRRPAILLGLGRRGGVAAAAHRAPGAAIELVLAAVAAAA